MKCIKCGVENSNSLFCSNCGEKLPQDKKVCKTCGSINSEKAQFCKECGKKLSEENAVDELVQVDTVSILDEINESYKHEENVLKEPNDLDKKEGNEASKCELYGTQNIMEARFCKVCGRMMNTKKVIENNNTSFENKSKKDDNEKNVNQEKKYGAIALIICGLTLFSGLTADIVALVLAIIGLDKMKKYSKDEYGYKATKNINLIALIVSIVLIVLKIILFIIIIVLVVREVASGNIPEYYF